MKLTFCSTVDQRFKTLWVLHVHHIHQGSVDPATRFDTVETADYHLELHVVFLILILNLSIVWRDLDTSDPSLYKSRRAFCF